jgi:hypothetical protein
LHEDIKDIAALVDRAPQIPTFAVDGEEDFIQMPLVTRSRMLAAQLIGIGLPKLATPIPHGFIGQGNAAFGHQLFDVPVAEAEAEIQPHTVADDFDREPVALIRVG